MLVDYEAETASVEAHIRTAESLPRRPRPEPPPPPIAVSKEVQNKEAIKKAQEAFVQARKKALADNEKMNAKMLEQQANLAVRPANLVARPANLENLVQQYMRQARPQVRAELIFVRKICELDVEHFRRINQHVEAEFKEVAKKLVEAQQLGRLRVAGRVQTVQTVDAPSLLREALVLVMKKDLSSEQFARYHAEVAKRDARRKQAAVRYLVDAIDRDLFLSEQQRHQVTESLSSHWEQTWDLALEYQLYGNAFYPIGVETYVTPLLDANQQKAWQGHQRVGGNSASFAVFGSFMNDNDALEVELGEGRKAEPDKKAKIGGPEFRKAPLRKAVPGDTVSKEAVPKSR